MTELVITVPGRARGKGRPRFSRASGRPYSDAKTVNAENWIKACAIEQVGQPVLEGPLELSMLVTIEVPKSWSKAKRASALAGRLRPTGKPDCDNFLKGVDSLNGIVWVDDSQVVRATVAKVYGEIASTVITVVTP